MGKIDDALHEIYALEDPTEKAFQLAGLISALFKVRNVELVVTGQLAVDIYANATSEEPEVELAVFSGKVTPRVAQEMLGEKMHGDGALWHWRIAGVSVRLYNSLFTERRELCRDFKTDYGHVKLHPVEELTAERLLVSIYPVPNEQAREQARLLLLHGLAENFIMDWGLLQTICSQPEYKIGEELAQLRTQTKQDLDAMATPPEEAHHEASLEAGAEKFQEPLR